VQNRTNRVVVHWLRRTFSQGAALCVLQRLGKTDSMLVVKHTGTTAEGLLQSPVLVQMHRSRAQSLLAYTGSTKDT
jgi:hypothetical protein